MDIFRHLDDFFKKYKSQYIIGILFLIIVDLLQLIPPKLIGFLIDLLKSKNISKASLAKYCFFIFGIALIIAGFRYLWRMKIIGGSRDLEYYLRDKLFSHYLILSPNFYNYNKTGDLMAHATNDLSGLRGAFGPGIIMLTDGIVLTISTIAVMSLSISPRLTLIALIPLPFLALLALTSGRCLRRHHNRVQASFSSLSDRVQESFSGIRVIKSFAQEAYEIDRFKDSSLDYIKKNMALTRLWGLLYPMIGLISSSSFLIALIYGGGLVIKNEISLGDFVSFLTYLGILTWPMAAIGWVINMLQRGKASLERINKILDTPSEITDDNALDITSLNPDIQISSLSFKYPSSEEYVLSDINVNLEVGKTLGIVGRTGSGKSTLGMLLLRGYNLEDFSSIKIGGYNIDSIPLNILRKNISIVPQESFLFSTTIEENLAFASANPSSEDILKVAKDVAIHDDIMEFPDQYKTIVGEKGVTLSGGQKQRISIGRALLKNPKILILDDCLSAVDAKTEAKILQSLKSNLKDTTSIIISHRLSTLRDSDEIIFLQDGKIVERGSHESLMELQGLYYEMYQRQLLEESLEEGGNHNE